MVTKCIHILYKTWIKFINKSTIFIRLKIERRVRLSLSFFLHKFLSSRIRIKIKRGRHVRSLKILLSFYLYSPFPLFQCSYLRWISLLYTHHENWGFWGTRWNFGSIFSGMTNYWKILGIAKIYGIPSILMEFIDKIVK